MSETLMKRACAALLTTASAGAMMVSAPAVAQDGDEDTIVVTGSRIERNPLASPAPINSIGAESIRSSGETDISKVLSELPALISSLPTNSTVNDGT